MIPTSHRDGLLSDWQRRVADALATLKAGKYDAEVPAATNVVATNLHANVASVIFSGVRTGKSVIFRCQINATASGISTFQTLCRLPADWRPVGNMYFIGWGTDGAEFHLEIQGDGDIVNVWGSAAWAASVGVRFNGAYIAA